MNSCKEKYQKFKTGCRRAPNDVGVKYTFPKKIAADNSEKSAGSQKLVGNEQRIFKLQESEQKLRDQLVAGRPRE